MRVFQRDRSPSGQSVLSVPFSGSWHNSIVKVEIDTDTVGPPVYSKGRNITWRDGRWYAEAEYDGQGTWTVSAHPVKQWLSGSSNRVRMAIMVEGRDQDGNGADQPKWNKVFHGSSQGIYGRSVATGTDAFQHVADTFCYDMPSPPPSPPPPSPPPLPPPSIPPPSPPPSPPPPSPPLSLIHISEPTRPY